jgi:ribosomal protein S27E
MKHKEYQQKRASLDDAYLMGDISLSDYARDSINLDRQYKEITSPSRNGLREVIFVPMKKHSRVKSSGKLIKCPKCGKTQRIFHLSWSSLSCQSCSWISDKYDWQIEKGAHEK